MHVIDAHPADVVDTTGAGDVYAAGFLYGFTHGHDLATCGQLGSLRRGGSDLAPRPASRRRPRRAREPCSDSGRWHGSPAIAPAIPSSTRTSTDLIAKVGDVNDADLVFELIVSAVRLAATVRRRGDLKIANAALKEMRYAFAVFEPYRAARKAAIFGSARTAATIRSTQQTGRSPPRARPADWMVITGAGAGVVVDASDAVAQRRL